MSFSNRHFGANTLSVGLDTSRMDSNGGRRKRLRKQVLTPRSDANTCPESENGGAEVNPAANQGEVESENGGVEANSTQTNEIEIESVDKTNTANEFEVESENGVRAKTTSTNEVEVGFVDKNVTEKYLQVPVYRFDCVGCGLHIESRALFRPYPREIEINRCIECETPQNIQNVRRRRSRGRSKKSMVDKTKKKENDPPPPPPKCDYNLRVKSLCDRPDCPLSSFPHYHQPPSNNH